MKNIMLLLTLFLLLSACADNSVDTTKYPNEAECRIVGKEHTIYSGYGYQIIEIDGVEYVATSHGGICPLVK